MNSDETLIALRELVTAGRGYVLAYARVNARHVTAEQLGAILAAIGEISIGEAIAALDRLEGEAHEGAVTH